MKATFKEGEDSNFVKHARIILFWLTCEYHWQPLRFIVSMFPMFYEGKRKHVLKKLPPQDGWQ